MNGECQRSEGDEHWVGIGIGISSVKGQTKHARPDPFPSQVKDVVNKQQNGMIRHLLGG